jgi:hypothetical protein
MDMTRLFFLVLVTLLIGNSHLHAQSWSKGSISGEGEVVKQEITLPSFDGIALGFNGDVFLTPGATQKVVIEGQQNIIDNIKREVEGGTWKINFIKSVNNAKDVKVYITIPTVDYVGLFGSGTIESTGKFGGLNQLDLALSGSGDLRMEYEANETELHISGSGDIKVRGSSKRLEISISGSGDVDATDLVTADCDVHISGSGDATVNVNGDLESQISGSGDVHYKGNASVTARVSGSGSVSKL